MSQNSLVIPTTGTLSGLALVTALDAALDTLNTLWSGSSAPTSPEAGQLWHDTANNQLKLRALDNTAWIVLFTLDETNKAVVNNKPAPLIYGLTLSNDSASPNTILDIAAGGIADTTNAYLMKLSSPITKGVTAWAAGTGNGMLDTGTLTASKWYHVHVIQNLTTAALDAVMSLSPTAPTLPSGFTIFNKIGAIYINSSGQISRFVQIGNRFQWVTPTVDNSGFSLTAGAAATAMTMNVPPGVRCMVEFRLTMNNTGAYGVLLLATSADESGTAGGGPGLAPIFNYYGTQGNYSAAPFRIPSNTSSQIFLSGNGSYSSSAIGMWTLTNAFEYPRGNS